MGKLMLGTEVAKAMKETLTLKTERLKEQGTVPCLAIVRVGERPDDISYERGAKKKMEGIGIECRSIVLEEAISMARFEEVIRGLNTEADVHGILLLIVPGRKVRRSRRR